MGLYRVDAMESLIRTVLMEPSQAILTSAIILQAINDGYKEVSSRAFCIEHEDAVTTTSGNRLVPFSGHRVNKVLYQSGKYWNDTFDTLNPAKWSPVVRIEAVGGVAKHTDAPQQSGSADSLGQINGDFSFEIEGYLPVASVYSDKLNLSFSAFYARTIGFYRLFTSGENRVYVTGTASTVRLDLAYPAESFINFKLRIVRNGATVTTYWYTVSTGWVQFETFSEVQEAYHGHLVISIQKDPASANLMYLDNLVFNSGAPVSPIEEINKGLLKIIPPVAGHANISGNSPQYWFQWGRYVVIEPVPDAAYPLTLSVSDYPTAALTLDTEYPTSLPDEFHPCIVDFACYVLSMRLKKWKQAGRFYNQYINGLKKRRKEYVDRKAEKRSIHAIPDNVKYADGRPWAH